MLPPPPRTADNKQTSESATSSLKPHENVSTTDTSSSIDKVDEKYNQRRVRVSHGPEELLLDSLMIYDQAPTEICRNVVML